MKGLQEKPRKERKDFFDRYLCEAYKIGMMLNEQGRTDAECRAYEQIASILLFVELSLRQIAKVLTFLLTFVICQLILRIF